MVQVEFDIKTEHKFQNIENITGRNPYVCLC